MEDALNAVLATIGPEDAFRCLSELLPDAAVFVVDSERNVVHWSDGAQKLLGFTREEALGRLCLSSIRCRTCTIGCGIAKHGSVSGFPLELFRADERWVPTKKYAKGFFNEAGEFQGGIEVLIPTGAPQVEEGGLAENVLLPPDAEQFHELVSRDAGMRRAFQTIRNVAETDATVLVRGESGTGKELVAHAIHLESHRSKGPFVAVNCAALTPGLLESELFGHLRGSFTGAVKDRKGLFQQAESGTLFLDEVAELPLEMQSKLLRVLEERVVTPVGASKEVPVDVRVVAATHRALRKEADAGRFREDLMYRLRVVPIFLPPLRERQGDVEVLLRFFLRRFNKAGPRHVETIAPEAMRALLNHRWPGNIRELRNVVEFAFAVGRGEELLLEELPPEFGEEERALDVSESDGEQSERERIREALQLEGGRVSAAAKRLGMSRATFWRKRQKHGLEPGGATCPTSSVSDRRRTVAPRARCHVPASA
jgi:transcriptional regulator with PAS, ATPase and Fis domain